MDEIEPRGDVWAAAKERGDIPVAYVKTAAEPVPVARCGVIARSTGERCKRWGLRGTTKIRELEDGTVEVYGTCVKHGARLPNVADHAAAVVEAARLRLIGLSDEAIDIVHDLAVNSTADQVRLKAATELLDRAGVRGGVEVDFGGNVEVTHETAADRARRLLEQTASRLATKIETERETDDEPTEDDPDVVDAELVEDE
jgi:hypothetical protein